MSEFSKKISTKNDWELCYLRHGYFKKASTHPTAQQFAQYDYILANAAKNTYFTYRNLLCCVGMELDDLIAICRVHLVSFLGLFSMEALYDKEQEFVQNFLSRNGKHPEAEDYIKKNKANLTLFLKQRMEDLIRTCRQKARDIRGFPQEEFMAFEGPTLPPEDPYFVDNYYEHGFRKIDGRALRAIRNKARPENPDSFCYEGVYYVAIKNEARLLSLEDLVGADVNPYDSNHHMGPEEIFIEKEDEVVLAQKWAKFNDFGPHRKTNLLNKFIHNHAGHPLYREELKMARQILSEIRV